MRPKSPTAALATLCAALTMPASLAHGGAAQASGVEPLSSGELLAACRAPAGSAGRQQCKHYIRGVLDAEQGYLPKSRRLICLPKGTSDDKLRQAVLTWLAREPDLANTPAAPHVMGALTSAYMCTVRGLYDPKDIVVD